MLKAFDTRCADSQKNLYNHLGDLDLDLDLLYFRAHTKERHGGALTYNEMQVLGSQLDRQFTGKFDTEVSERSHET